MIECVHGRCAYEYFIKQACVVTADRCGLGCRLQMMQCTCPKD